MYIHKHLEYIGGQPMLPLKWLEIVEACQPEASIIEQMYPNGLPMTRETVIALRDRHITVEWGLVRLLDYPQIADFIRYCLGLLHPYLVRYLVEGSWDDLSRLCDKISFETAWDCAQAGPTLARISEELESNGYMILSALFYRAYHFSMIVIPGSADITDADEVVKWAIQSVTDGKSVVLNSIYNYLCTVIEHNISKSG